MMNGSTGSLGDHVNGKQVQSVDPPGLSSFNNGPRHRLLNALKRCRGILFLVIMPVTACMMMVYLAPVTTFVVRSFSVHPWEQGDEQLHAGAGQLHGLELLSWCLRRPFVGLLPASSATLVTLESTEVFGLEAADVKYVTKHFRYTFTNERVRRSARYYSPGWRTWAAVAVQLAWGCYKHRKTLESLSFIRPRWPLSRYSSLGEEQLRLYTAILASPKPNQDDDFSF